MARIFVVGSKIKADFTAYNVSSKTRADLLVTELKSKAQAKGDVLWF